MAPKKAATPKETTTEVASVDPVKDRTESYEAVRPDGVVVTVHRNIDTGESRIEESDS